MRNLMYDIQAEARKCNHIATFPPGPDPDTDSDPSIMPN
jgi:hypothetical protein